MKKNLIALVFSSSLSLGIYAAAPTNYMSYIGGGGEPLGEKTTQFDLGLNNFSNYAVDENKNYNITVNFNGGHTETEKMLKDKFKGSRVVENFTKENFNKMVDDYMNLLSNNKIPEDGKILLFINSHGGEAVGNTHEISVARSAITNFNTGSKDGMVSLDVLEKLSALAEKKNVKLAIIDASCHSGNSIKLANSKTCIISASGPKHYGFSNFAEAFAGQMKKGKNLEEIYLSAREMIGGDGFPEISTPEGLEVQNELYPLITPYLYFHDVYRGATLDKIDIYLKDQAKGYSENACKRADDFKNLNAILKLIEDVSSVEKGIFAKKMERTLDLDKLRASIAKYQEVQENYLKKLSKLQSADLKKVEPMILYNGEENTGYTHEELLSTDWDFNINEKNKDLEEGNLPEPRIAELERSRDIFIKAKEKKAEILKNYPNYSESQKIIDSLKTDASVSRANASDIAKEVQKAYASYYNAKKEKLSEEAKPKKNACNDFVL